MGASAIISPEEETAVEEETRKTGEPQLKPKPLEPKPQRRKTLSEIFKGHEDFLGWTPD